MFKRIGSVLTIWALAVGCCIAFSDEPEHAAPPAATAVPPPAVVPPASPPAAPVLRQTAAPVPSGEPSAAEQMQALARHAGKGMICYTATRGSLATAGREVIPLALKAVPAPRK